MIQQQRIQLSRKRGFRLQEHSLAQNGLPAVKVDRTTKWGNPFAPKQIDGHWYLTRGTKTLELCRDREHAVKLAMCSFEAALRLGQLPFTTAEVRVAFASANPACWCAIGAHCHGDVILKIARIHPRPAPFDTLPTTTGNVLVPTKKEP